jgi:hypothetical protein
MRYLNKQHWPYKIRIEGFDHTTHENFSSRYPSIKTRAIERTSKWSNNKKLYGHDVYFTKESDLVFYRLSAQ